MQDLNDKVTGGNLPAAEWNEVPSELQNVITETGQGLTSADLNQVGKAMATYASSGDAYNDGGAANSYVLSTVSAKQAPVAYTDGMSIRFFAGNANTSASTVNVAGLGVKNLKSSNGDDLLAGDIPTDEYTSAVYLLASDEFRLVPVLTQANKIELKSGRLNRIINGGFDVWQRGGSQTSNGYGSDDMWRNTNFNTTKLHSRQSFANGQTLVPGNPKYFSRTVVTSIAGANSLCQKSQRIKGVNSYAGETVTVSFYFAADTTREISIEALQFFGTGGSPSATLNGISIKKISVDTIFKRYELLLEIPSVAGKVVGDNNDDYLELNFWFDAGSNFNTRTDSLGQQSGTFDIYGVQIDKGVYATEFEQLSGETVLQECMAYFWRSGNDIYVPLASNNDTVRIFTLQNPTPMRSTPTISATSNLGVVSIINTGTISSTIQVSSVTAADVVILDSISLSAEL